MTKNSQVASNSILNPGSTHPIYHPLTNPRFVRISRITFLLLDIYTAGLYRKYGFYVNWKAIKEVEDSNISPFCRSIFTFLYVRELFEYITKQAHQSGYKSLRTKRYADIYVALTKLQIILFPILAISLAILPKQIINGAAAIISTLPLIKNLTCWPIQKTINLYISNVWTIRVIQLQEQK